MPEFLNAFLGWYLSSWGRIGRKEFGIALTVVTLPGLALMLLGWGNSAGNFFEPLSSLSTMSKGMSGGGDYSGALNYMQGLADTGGGANRPAAPITATMDWSGLVNGLCLLALIPLSRMRLRDMGWEGHAQTAMTVLFNLSVVNGLIESVSGYDVLPMGFLFGMANFFGYGWLSFAKGKAKVAPHEKVPANWEPPAIAAPTQPINPVNPAATPRKTYLNHDPED